MLINFLLSSNLSISFFSLCVELVAAYLHAWFPFSFIHSLHKLANFTALGPSVRHNKLGQWHKVRSYVDEQLQALWVWTRGRVDSFDTLIDLPEFLVFFFFFLIAEAEVTWSVWGFPPMSQVSSGSLYLLFLTLLFLSVCYFETSLLKYHRLPGT